MMTSRPISGLPLAGAFILAALGAQVAHAQAQTSTVPELKEPEERTIIVSIKNPSADLDSYAGSATDIDVDDLDARNVTDLSSLSYVAPNVQLDPIGTFKGVANFSIRGLGINSSIPSIEPAVGLFVDGVYMGVNAGTVFDLVDVRSVELLRGPQGVAFGHNTTGGAVLINTADPFVNDQTLGEEMGHRMGARVEIMQDMGHWWMMQDPKRGAEVLEQFWASL